MESWKSQNHRHREYIDGYQGREVGEMEDAGQ